MDGVELPVDNVLDLATDFLGKGYTEKLDSRFLSADGLRQVRMGIGDIAPQPGPAHINFEILGPNPKRPGVNSVIQNYHILLQGE
jgi:hypothetical protein